MAAGVQTAVVEDQPYGLDNYVELLYYDHLPAQKLTRSS